MGNYIFLSDEVIARLQSGKCVEGSMSMDPCSGVVSFKAYNRLSRQPGYRDRLIAQLEHGWIKESAQRYKFYNSVRKDLGVPMTKVVMERELKTAVHELEIERIIDLM